MATTMFRTYPLLIGGAWKEAGEPLDVTSPATGEVVGRTYQADAATLEEAVQATVRAFEVTRKLPAYERAAILLKIADGISAQHEEIAHLMALESGKPIRDCRVETTRAAFTFRQAAGEAERLGGEVIPLDLMPTSKGRMGITRRVPVGPVLGISPFNFPLNLAGHKIAPALAAGCSILLKPPSADPLTMLFVAHIIAEAGVPAGAVNIVPTSRTLGDRLVQDERFKLLTFTGSMDVGWRMKAMAGRKKVVLELGGNAAVIVDQDADLDFAAKRITAGGYGYAGQTCISVQRVYVHAAVADAFLGKLKANAEALKLGDPLDEATDVGPMIDEKALDRTAAWVQEAVAEGAKIITGGARQGHCFQPTILTNVKRESKVCSREVFAPIVAVFTFEAFDEALKAVNDSDYGLQAGVFTQNLGHAFQAFNELEVGGVVVNDISTYRIDHMPYGGVKESGLGREGLKYAIEDMTELRLMALNGVL
ncbi:MAG TPA: aldehyde dehydrogenase family protein [Ktedonobacterales bacterium]